MKHKLLVIIALVMFLMLPTFAGAQESEKDFLYKMGNDGSITITAYTGTDADVKIPAQIAGRSVTAIGDGAFGDNDQLVSVVIPEGVISIGNAAFQNCFNLVNVSLPSSLSTIGESAFNSWHSSSKS